MPEESRMPKAELSRAGRRVREVKTASQWQDEALTGRKRGEGMARLSDFNAERGWFRSCWRVKSGFHVRLPG